MIERIKSFIELVRPINCLMAAMAVTISEMISLGHLASFYEMLVSACVVIFITAGGNVLNDYFDYEIDKVVHKKRPLPSARILPDQAKITALLLLVIGAFLSAFLNEACFLITVLNVLLLISYEKSLKNRGILGNIAISYLVASLFLFGGLVVENLERIMVLVLLAFLVCLAREIQKDIEDIEGDRKKRKTLVMQVGEKISSAIALILLTLASILSFIPLIEGIFGWGYTSIIVADSLFVFAGIIGFRNASLAQRMIKTGMFLSIGSFMIGGI
ncbi:UbiA family prenyltransferase [bacterium]|nr:UbiA family prenyltransferase [bacterium]